MTILRVYRVRTIGMTESHPIGGLSPTPGYKSQHNRFDLNRKQNYNYMNINSCGGKEQMTDFIHSFLTSLPFDNNNNNNNDNHHLYIFVHHSTLAVHHHTSAAPTVYSVHQQCRYYLTPQLTQTTLAVSKYTISIHSTVIVEPN